MMIFDTLPFWIFFIGTSISILIFIFLGYWLGKFIRNRSGEEKEASVSTVTGSILGILGFFLVFTFSIVSNRFDARKELVRNEANAIGTAWLRSEFMPETEHGIAGKLFKEYVIGCISDPRKTTLLIQKDLNRSFEIQNELWQMAVINANKDVQSHPAALYVDALNNMIDIHSLRTSVALQTRIPGAIWFFLFLLVFLGMFAVGYQVANANSKLSWLTPFLAVAFALLITLIAIIDHPTNKLITVSQQSLIDLKNTMDQSIH